MLADVFEPALRRGHPVMVGVRRVVPDMLLMAALEFGDPVTALIHVKVNDLALDGGWRRWRGLHRLSLRALSGRRVFLSRQRRLRLWTN